MLNEDRKIREKLKQKTWNEIKTNDSWAIFKIMGEFVNGYEKLSRIGPCVSIFGSARTKPDHKYYKLAVDVAQKASIDQRIRKPRVWLRQVVQSDFDVDAVVANLLVLVEQDQVEHAVVVVRTDELRASDVLGDLFGLDEVALDVDHEHLLEGV